MNQDLTNPELSIEEARKILGKAAESMSDEQLKDQMTMMKFLAESWLEEYEKSIFDGKTFNEVISSK